MSDLFELYVRSYDITPENEPEFFSYIGDLYFTDEIQGLKRYPQHADINRLQHITSVTYLSYRLAKKKGLDVRSVCRGAILHDLFYYDWHDPDWSHRPHGYRHPGFALKNARILTDNGLSAKEENIILRHMWPLTVVPPGSREGLLVSCCDKYCATTELLIAKGGGVARKFRRMRKSEN